MEEKLTIASGLKKLKIIEKKIKNNIEKINEYATTADNLIPIFNNDETQKSEVQKLIQSNNDLAKDFLDLHTRIHETNLKTSLTIGKTTYTIHQILQIKAKIGNLMKETYRALNDNQFNKIINGRKFGDSTVPVNVKRFYDETEKNENLKKWDNILDEINMKLEDINARTELL